MKGSIYRLPADIFWASYQLDNKWVKFDKKFTWIAIIQDSKLKLYANQKQHRPRWIIYEYIPILCKTTLIFFSLV